MMNFNEYRITINIYGKSFKSLNEETVFTSHDYCRIISRRISIVINKSRKYFMHTIIRYFTCELLVINPAYCTIKMQTHCCRHIKLRALLSRLLTRL